MQLRHYGGRTAFSGVISTVRCHRDNALVKAALAEPGEGRVLVVDGHGLAGVGAHGRPHRGVGRRERAGRVWSSTVRCATWPPCATCRSGALALGSNPRKSAKDGVGERDVPVAFGGVEFVPGQTLWADEDGVVATRP